ncbi:hypothetical protein C7212DRAFT_363283 [Tuber magnatum]|uniref:Uncharacterized protein n=1 Tax=Tuber magnatum TaxID=42249 RepID=A0A317SRL5_9PEZI|nr:hypothetical protein C7212DRAFT_363283 [Tuber magnatum]
MSINNHVSAYPAVDSQSMGLFATLGNRADKATGGHTPTPPDGRKRSRPDGDDESNSESEAIPYQYQKYLFTECSFERLLTGEYSSGKSCAERKRRILGVIGETDRLFGGGGTHSPTSSSTSCSNSSGSCASIIGGSFSIGAGTSMSRSTGTGTLFGDPPAPQLERVPDHPNYSYPLNRYLNESPKDGGPTLLAGMSAMGENSSLESYRSPCSEFPTDPTLTVSRDRANRYPIELEEQEGSGIRNHRYAIIHKYPSTPRVYAVLTGVDTIGPFTTRLEWLLWQVFVCASRIGSISSYRKE